MFGRLYIKDTDQDLVSVSYGTLYMVHRYDILELVELQGNVRRWVMGRAQPHISINLHMPPYAALTNARVEYHSVMYV